MNALFAIIAVTAATFGWLVGYFSRGRIRPTAFICTITPIVAQAVILCLLPQAGDARDERVQERLFVECGVIPFLLLTVPCLTTGVLTALVVVHTKPKA